MKTKLVVSEDMRWRKGDKVAFTIGSVDYRADVDDVIIDSSKSRYEYELNLERDRSQL